MPADLAITGVDTAAFLPVTAGNGSVSAAAVTLSASAAPGRDFRRILAEEATRLSAPLITPPATTVSEPLPDDGFDTILDGILLLLINLQSSDPLASLIGRLNPGASLPPSESATTASTRMFLLAAEQRDTRNLFEDNQLQQTTPIPGPAAASQSALPVAAGDTPFSIVPTATAAAAPDIRVPAAQQLPQPIDERLPHQTAPLLPAQVPVVTNLMPPISLPGNVIVEVPAPVGPAEPHPGLPASDIGERPMMSGDRYAAIIATAAQLLPVASTKAFETTLAHVALAEAQATTTDTNSVPPDRAVPLLPQPVVSTPPADANWAEAIAVRMRTGPHGEPVTLSFQLQPKELGTLHVQVQLQDQQIRAQLLVPNQEVRQFLESHLPDLRQRLEAMGLAIGSLDVTVDSGSPGYTATHHPQDDGTVSPYNTMISVHQRVPKDPVEIGVTAVDGGESLNNPSPRLDVIA